MVKNRYTRANETTIFCLYYSLGVKFAWAVDCRTYLWYGLYRCPTRYECCGVFAGWAHLLSRQCSLFKPIAIILSLPAILVTLGLFTVVVNGFMVYISLILAPGLKMTFLHSILTGLIMSLVNYIVSSALELNYGRRQEEQHES